MPNGSRTSWRPRTHEVTARTLLLGGTLGAVLGLVGYAPMALWMQRAMHVPHPHFLPRGVPMSADPPAPGYWISWGLAAIPVIVLAVAIIPWRPARQVVLPCAFAFLVVAAFAAWFFISMDLRFSPD